VLAVGHESQLRLQAQADTIGVRVHIASAKALGASDPSREPAWALERMRRLPAASLGG
jgi:hypothetical protein